MGAMEETSGSRPIWPPLSNRWTACLAVLLVLAVSMLTRTKARAADTAPPATNAADTNLATTPQSSATAPAPDNPFLTVSGRMWVIDNGAPPWEFILRGGIVYVFILVLLRLTGKRQVGQLAPFDLVLLLVLSNAVQNAMNGGDNSVTGGMISAVTLVGLNYIVGWMTFKSKKLETLIEGKPVILIHNGHIDHQAMNGARMTVHELNAALRAGGCAGPHEVKIAVLENGGNISVIRNDHFHDHPPITRANPPHTKPNTNA